MKHIQYFKNIKTYAFTFETLLHHIFPATTSIIILMITCSTFCKNNCTSLEENEILTVNCTGQGWTQIPQDLGNNVNILILSYNKIQDLNETNFENYRHLQELYLNGNDLSNVVLQRTIFRLLTNLQVLDLSDIGHIYPFRLKWPKRLKWLSVNNNLMQYVLRLTELDRLEILFANNCSLTEFPFIKPKAPLKQLYLKYNPLDNFIQDDLFLFKKLVILDLLWTIDSPMNTSYKWCECRQIQVWIYANNVDSPNLNCSNQGFDVSCFEDDSPNVRKTKTAINCPQFMSLLIILVMILCVVIPYFIIFVYKNAKKYFEKPEEPTDDYEEEMTTQF